MRDAFLKAFGRAVDGAVEGARSAFADIRHEVLGGWFGRNFEPHPTRQQPDLGWTLPREERAHEPEQEQPDRERGIDR